MMDDFISYQHTLELVADCQSAAGFHPAPQGYDGTNMKMTLRLIGALVVVGAIVAYAKKGPPIELAGVSCETPPPLHCPDASCPTELVVNQGHTGEPKTGRKLFLDSHCHLNLRE